MVALRYRGLLIGNNFYADPALSTLKGPERDVEAMKAALTDEQWGLFRDEDVRALYGRPEATIRRALGSFFGGSRPDDVLLVYFSGHGVNDDNDLFLCAEDTRTENLLATAVGASFVTQLADRAPAQRVVVLLDCCHSGLYKSDADYTALEGRGRFILTSTYGPGKSPDAGDGPTPFTAELARALTGAAVDANGQVTFRSVAAYVSRTVHQKTGHAVGTGGRGSGDLTLARLGGRPAPVQDPPPTPAAPGPPPDPVWPTTPSRHDVEQALSRWTADHPLLPERLVHRITSVRPASTLRLTLVVMEEHRSERVVRRAATDRLPPHQYVGHIADAETPIDRERDQWSEQSFHGWRRGSESVQPCEKCDDGLVRCDKCRGRGKIAPPGTDSNSGMTRCPRCQGSGRSNCRECRGCGEMRTYREGRIRRVRVVTPAWATEELPARRTGPYVEIGAIDNLAGVPLPAAARDEVDRMRKILSRVAGRQRARVDAAVLPEFVVDFFDGSVTRRARLVGDGLTVHLPTHSVVAMHLRQVPAAAAGLGRTVRAHPVLTAIVVALIVALAIWVGPPN